MLTTLLSYLPIPLAPLTAIALVAILQRLLRLPHRSAAAPIAGATALAPATPNPPPTPTWETVTRRWNPVITGVLPILTSIAIVLLVLWPFAYLGNVIMRLGEADPGWGQQVPPWFGNFGYFLGLGIVGLLTAVFGAVVIGFVGAGLHAMGKCLVWPAVCSFCNDIEPDCTAENDPANDAGRIA